MTKNHLTSQTFLVMHGDILIDIDLSDFINFHAERNTTATIALTSVVDPSAFGEVVLHGSRITKFIEKPQKGSQSSQLISCGVYLFEKEIFDFIPKKGACLLENIFPRLATLKKLSGFLFEGKWVDIGTPASYEKAIKTWGKR